jgi:hypothetical protein
MEVERRGAEVRTVVCSRNRILVLFRYLGARETLNSPERSDGDWRSTTQINAGGKTAPLKKSSSSS